jgi:hypothetical protein
VLLSLPLSTKEEREEMEKLAVALKSEYPTHLQLMVEILQKVAGAQGKEEPKFSLEKVLNLSYHIKWECYQSEIKFGSSNVPLKNWACGLQVQP